MRLKFLGYFKIWASFAKKFKTIFSSSMKNKDKIILFIYQIEFILIKLKLSTIINNESTLEKYFIQTGFMKYFMAWGKKTFVLFHHSNIHIIFLKDKTLLPLHVHVCLVKTFFFFSRKVKRYLEKFQWSCDTWRCWKILQI